MKRPIMLGVGWRFVVVDRPLAVPFAMQKVEGSSPFSRSLRKPSKSEGFSLAERREQVLSRPALPPGATKPSERTGRVVVGDDRSNLGRCPY